MSQRPQFHSALTAAARIASEYGWRVYLVGGSVRDALLGIPNGDIDISVEGDAHALANLLAQEIGAEIELHDRFDTATVKVRSPGSEIQNQIDFVMARRETYVAPGALPTIEAGTIGDDLVRRDFTVNAMAVSLTPEGPGDLVDPHGGLADLDARLIRVLHARSFRDDPTRLIRAVRLADRLGFRIEPNTLEFMLQAIRDGALYTVSTDRAVRELLKTLEEPNAGAMLASLEKLGLLQAIHPALQWPYPPDRLDIASENTLTPIERRDAYLAAIGTEFANQPEEGTQLARALNLTAPHVKLMHDAARLMQVWPKLGELEVARSQVYSLLHPLDVNVLEAYTRIKALSADTLAWERLHSYLATLRHIKPHLTGDYLRQLGLTPGPAYKNVLQALLRAKLDGELESRADEETFVKEWLEREELGTGNTA